MGRVRVVLLLEALAMGDVARPPARGMDFFYRACSNAAYKEFMWPSLATWGWNQWWALVHDVGWWATLIFVGGGGIVQRRWTSVSLTRGFEEEGWARCPASGWKTDIELSSLMTTVGEHAAGTLCGRRWGWMTEQWRKWEIVPVHWNGAWLLKRRWLPGGTNTTPGTTWTLQLYGHHAKIFFISNALYAPRRRGCKHWLFWYYKH